MYSSDEQKQHRKDWVTALRSGEYKQGQCSLRNTDNAYCCLGVAADVCGLFVPLLSLQESHNYFYYGDTTKDADSLVLNKDIMDYYGLTTSSGIYSNSDFYENFTHTSLVIDNDNNRLSFVQIANIIESEPEGLFV